MVDEPEIELSHVVLEVKVNERFRLVSSCSLTFFAISCAIATFLCRVRDSIALQGLVNHLVDRLVHRLVRAYDELEGVDNLLDDLEDLFVHVCIHPLLEFIFGEDSFLDQLLHFADHSDAEMWDALLDRLLLFLHGALNVFEDGLLCDSNETILVKHLCGLGLVVCLPLLVIVEEVLH